MRITAIELIIHSSFYSPHSFFYEISRDPWRKVFIYPISFKGPFICAANTAKTKARRRIFSIFLTKESFSPWDFFFAILLLSFLPQIIEKSGRVAFISFHSLEDRLVKNWSKEINKQDIIKILNKKPITASTHELEVNPRSRSAKLRIIEKI